MSDALPTKSKCKREIEILPCEYKNIWKISCRKCRLLCYIVIIFVCDCSIRTDQLSISVSPTNSFIGEGGTAQFTATASGVNMRIFLYQWRKKHDRLPNKVSGVNRAVLIIPNLVESDEGMYYCTVTNEWGNSVNSGDVTLSVKGMICNSYTMAMKDLHGPQAKAYIYIYMYIYIRGILSGHRISNHPKTALL